MMQCQNLYKSSSKQTIQTICILIHMISFNFVLIIKKSDALHEHILHKIGVLFGLNSNLQAKTKNISQPESNDIESLINLIISNTKGQNNGIFNICGSWKDHPRGYSAIVQKIVYDKLSIKISGIIFSLDGNGWNFTSHITNDETITKIFFFAMS